MEFQAIGLPPKGRAGLQPVIPSRQLSRGKSWRKPIPSRHWLIRIIFYVALEWWELFMPTLLRWVLASKFSSQFPSLDGIDIKVFLLSPSTKQEGLCIEIYKEWWFTFQSCKKNNHFQLNFKSIKHLNYSKRLAALACCVKLRQICEQWPHFSS